MVPLTPGTATASGWRPVLVPKALFRGIDINELIRQSHKYQPHGTLSNAHLCSVCKTIHAEGLFLNDQSFVCQPCCAEFALRTFPEKYEMAERMFAEQTKRRTQSWAEFQQQHGYVFVDSPLVMIAWASIPLVFMNPFCLLLTFVLFGLGYRQRRRSKDKAINRAKLATIWQEENPEPIRTPTKYFHDPTAELSARDEALLRIFLHWPGYPPFWFALRKEVRRLDGHRCQVTGCPSRLPLHTHHILSVREGGPHIPENLVTLCVFHHALEASAGHQELWTDVRNQYFTLVRQHRRGNHGVKRHLRRLALVSLPEILSLQTTFGLCCPRCNIDALRFLILPDENRVQVSCNNCRYGNHVTQQLTEETAPKLASILIVTRNRGRWPLRPLPSDLLI